MIIGVSVVRGLGLYFVKSNIRGVILVRGTSKKKSRYLVLVAHRGGCWCTGVWNGAVDDGVDAVDAVSSPRWLKFL